MQPFSKYLCFVLLFVSLKSFAQKEIQDSIASERLRLNQTHLYVLGAWAAANIVQGSISASNTTGKEHYLHQMNAYWNTVNLAIAGAGLYMVKGKWPGNLVWPITCVNRQKSKNYFY